MSTHEVSTSAACPRDAQPDPAQPLAELEQHAAPSAEGDSVSDAQAVRDALAIVPVIVTRIELWPIDRPRTREWAWGTLYGRVVKCSV